MERLSVPTENTVERRDDIAQIAHYARARGKPWKTALPHANFTSDAHCGDHDCGTNARSGPRHGRGSHEPRPKMIKSALTPEDWKREKASNESERDLWARLQMKDRERPNRHALAAIALYRQPFGFTRAEAQQLRDIATRIKAKEILIHERSILDGVAEKIEALLPAEGND